MEEELLLKRMAANPVSARHPRQDPGSMCRAGCRSQWSSFDADVAQIASDCAAEAKRVHTRCAVTPSKITQCLGNNPINLGVCSAQRRANGQKWGMANMDCQTCCASFSSGRVPIATCMAHFTNVELDSSRPPMQ